MVHMAPRALDAASLSFGLVSIPVKVFSTSAPSEEVHFHLVHAKCGTRLKQQYICPKDDEVVERSEMAKGYEKSRGKYVIFSAEELDALDAVSDDTIALQEFLPAALIDPIYVERSYYLRPGKGGEQAYALLTAAMERAGLVGLASYNARGKQYLTEVRPFQDGLVMHQLRYPDEIKPWDEVPMPALPKTKKSELELAGQIIAGITSEQFEPDKYRDEVKERVRALIEQKAEGEEITAPEPEKRAKVIDLMAALKASLDGGGKKAQAPGQKNGHRKASKADGARSAKARNGKKEPARKPAAKAPSRRRARAGSVEAKRPSSRSASA
jgi:DNA end-binding protein Ku